MTVPLKLLELTTRAAWRRWLAAHHDRESEVWLVYAKVHTGKRRIAYVEAVEEALCFGWIDSIVRRLDDDRYAQKYTPRRAGSRWSKLNRARFQRMVEEGRMMAAGLAVAPPAADDTPPRLGAGDVPPYVETALRQDVRAWENFCALPPSHRKNYLRWIDEAKREETRQRRLAEAIEKLRRNERLGMK